MSNYYYLLKGYTEHDLVSVICKDIHEALKKSELISKTLNIPVVMHMIDAHKFDGTASQYDCLKCWANPDHEIHSEKAIKGYIVDI